MKDSINNCDVVIVGAGLYGAVIAERLSRNQKKVLVIESRNHIGGNCYTYNDDETGINVHAYGPHIFHTSNEKVWGYITNFTDFNKYRHKCVSKTNGRIYSMPINLDTINSFLNTNFTPQEAKELINKIKFLGTPTNFEEQALSLVGPGLYNTFIKGYTEKQWGRNPKDLPASVALRLPVRFNYNDRYYNDTWEGIPISGYTPIFKKMLTHPNIEVKLNCDFFDVKHLIPDSKTVIYSGPLDRLFDYKYGRLSWRTCDFHLEKFDIEDYQGVTQVNYPDLTVPYTRTIEFKHFHPEQRHQKEKTIVSFEYSKETGANDTPYYPVSSIDDKQKLALYSQDVQQLSNYIVGGRLGEYKYYDMHQVISNALDTYEKRLKT